MSQGLWSNLFIEDYEVTYFREDYGVFNDTCSRTKPSATHELSCLYSDECVGVA